MDIIFNILQWIGFLGICFYALFVVNGVIKWLIKTHKNA